MENMEKEDATCKDCGCSCCGGKKCNCPHHKAVPVFIILIALAFLLGNWGILSAGAVGIIWPILLAAIGFTKLNASKCKCC